MVKPQRELIGFGRHFRRGCIRMRLEGTGGVIGHRIAGQHCRNGRIDGHCQRICGTVGVSDGIQPRALGGRWHRHHLRGSQHLAKALVLDEVEGALAAIVDAGDQHRPAVGEAELIAAKGGNAAWIGQRRMIEVVARVEGGVAHKLEERSVKAALAGTSDDVGESRCAAADLGRHPTRAGFNSLHRVHVEVTEGGAAHLRIADVGAVHGKGRLNAALAVDGELLSKVGGAVDVSHGAGGQQQKRAEIALVQRQFAHRLARQLFAAGRRLALEDGHCKFASA